MTKLKKTESCPHGLRDYITCVLCEAEMRESYDLHQLRLKLAQEYIVETLHVTDTDFFVLKPDKALAMADDLLATWRGKK